VSTRPGKCGQSKLGRFLPRIALRYSVIPRNFDEQNIYSRYVGYIIGKIGEPWEHSMLKFDEALSLVTSIIKSPAIVGYNIGITCNPRSRRQSYRGVGYKHFSIIDFGLSSKDALKLEKKLYETLTMDMRSLTYRKYRANAKDIAYRPNLGGKPLDNEDEYLLYVAWWNVGDRGYVHP
jgi:hypothetical protein